MSSKKERECPCHFCFARHCDGDGGCADYEDWLMEEIHGDDEVKKDE